MTLKFNRILEVAVIHVCANFIKLSYRIHRETKKTWRQCRKQCCPRFRGH